MIAENFSGGPVGIETIAAALGEARDAIEEIVEPYLMQQGFVQRTPRGRLLTGAAYGHLGLPPPPRDPAQIGLFSDDKRHMSVAEPQSGLGHFDGKMHILPLRVYYEDTDLSGVVYHANYLRYMERGRTEFFRLAGVTKMADLDSAEPTAWAIREVRRSLSSPGRLDDPLDGADRACPPSPARASQRSRRSMPAELCWSKGGSKPASSR